eukprot:6178297-Pleurochrysis_carterae.AAC.1
MTKAKTPASQRVVRRRVTVSREGQLATETVGHRSRDGGSAVDCKCMSAQSTRRKARDARSTLSLRLSARQPETPTRLQRAPRLPRRSEARVPHEAHRVLRAHRARASS